MDDGYAHFQPSGNNGDQQSFGMSQPEWIDDLPERIVDLPQSVVSDVNDWHMPMLNDIQRNEAYKAALDKVVTPDTIVLEIGVGSGILSMLAAKAGAKHVYAIEASQHFYNIARRNIMLNGFQDKITLVAGMSQDVKIGNPDEDPKSIPVKCNLLVAEILGTMLDGESCVHYYEDARRRLLTPDAKIIPALGRQYASLIGSEQLKQITQSFNYDGLHLEEFNRFRDSVSLFFSKNYGVVLNHLDDLRELCEPLEIYEVDFMKQGLRDLPLGGKRILSANVTDSGEAVAIMYWWEVFLDEEHTIKITTRAIETFGNIPRDLNWGQGLTLVEHPDGWQEELPRPCTLRQGDTVKVQFTSQRLNAAYFHAKVVDTGAPSQGRGRGRNRRGRGRRRHNKHRNRGKRGGDRQNNESQL